nr:GNAT family N-acetyltransferase [Bacillus pinisoli]
MDKYQDGDWLVWYKNKARVAITYHVEHAPSNNRPWIGTVLVSPSERRLGIGKKVVEQLRGELSERGHKAVYAAVPVERNQWIQFLASCGFEQFKLEKENDKMYLVFVLPS